MKHSMIFGFAALALACGGATTAVRAQDPAGCRQDFAMLSDDDWRSGKPVPEYCPYGYGPGQPYGAAPAIAPSPRSPGRSASRRTRERERRVY